MHSLQNQTRPFLRTVFLMAICTCVLCVVTLFLSCNRDDDSLDTAPDSSSSSSSAPASGTADTNFSISGDEIITSMSLDTDSSGNLYVGMTELRGGVETDWRLRKYTTNGTEITAGWNKLIDGDSSTDFDMLRDIAADSAGNLYCAGVEDGSSTSELAWLKKFAEDGTEDGGWDLQPGFTGNGSDALAITVAPDGQIWTGGLFKNTESNYQWFINEYNPDGSSTDCASVYYDAGFSRDNYFKDLCVGSAGNIYALGYSRVDDAVKNMVSLRAYNSELVCQWSNNFGDTEEQKDYKVEAMCCDETGNLYVIGTAKKLSSASSGVDVYVKKFNSSGTEVTAGWDKVFDHNNLDQTAVSILTGPGGTIYICYSSSDSSVSEKHWHVTSFSADGTEVENNWQKTITRDYSTSFLGLFFDAEYGYLFGTVKNYISDSSGLDWLIERYYR